MTSPSNAGSVTGNGAGALLALARSPRAELEARLGVGSVEVLHARRRRLVNRHAELLARTEPKMWDARRKALLALILVELHDSYGAEGARKGEKKPPVDILDAMARTDARYTGFLDGITLDIARAKWVEDKIKELDELINRDQRLIGYVTAEARL